MDNVKHQSFTVDSVHLGLKYLNLGTTWACLNWYIVLCTFVEVLLVPKMQNKCKTVGVVFLWFSQNVIILKLFKV